MNRRELLKTGAAMAGSGAFEALRPDAAAALPPVRQICLFTDHLDDHGYTYAEVARMLQQLGFTGVDLTVRPGGLVAPERAADELPKAVAAFRAARVSVPMISTGLTRADEGARSLLSAAGRLGIRYFKAGYYHYDDPARWRERLNAAKADLTPLVRLAREARVQCGIHNHAGPSVGGALWDGWELLEGLDPEWAGFYFDPAQATIEGGVHGWRLNFQRIAPRLKMVALKDFIWEKADGKWRTRWVPLGEGMVRWDLFFKDLAQVPFHGPLSLHIEYDPGGGTRAERWEKSLLAAERDLKILRRHLDAASIPIGT